MNSPFDRLCEDYGCHRGEEVAALKAERDAYRHHLEQVVAAWQSYDCNQAVSGVLPAEKWRRFCEAIGAAVVMLDKGSSGNRTHTGEAS